MHGHITEFAQDSKEMIQTITKLYFENMSKQQRYNKP